MLGHVGSNFTVEFEEKEGTEKLREQLRQDAVTIRGAGVQSVVDTTEETKERLRDYLDLYFIRSEVIGGAMDSKSRTGKARRRATFAMAQSKYYDDVAQKGQYTGQIYSKFGRGKGPKNFVDYLILHLRGGTVRPKQGDWLKLTNRAIPGNTGIGHQVGDYPTSNSRIFLKKSPGGRKMFLLRETFGFGQGRRKEDRKVELLATYLKSISFTPRLTNLDTIAATRIDLFDKKFRAALDTRLGTE